MASTQELLQDVAAARADGHAQPDLAGALGDRDQHDVHDADAADDQRDRGDAREQGREHAGDRAHQGLELAHVADVEVVVLAGQDVPTLAQERLDLLLGLVGARLRDRGDHHHADAVVAGDAARRRSCRASSPRRPGPGRRWRCPSPSSRRRPRRSSRAGGSRRPAAPGRRAARARGSRRSGSAWRRCSGRPVEEPPAVDGPVADLEVLGRDAVEAGAAVLRSP
jgi:hypothetical protein